MLDDAYICAAALLDILVFGRRAGVNAARYIREVGADVGKEVAGAGEEVVRGLLIGSHGG